MTRAASALLLSAALLSTACWDRPVSERVTLEIHDGADAPLAVTARVETTLGWPSDPEKQPAAMDRLGALARDIVEGRGPWADAFARVEGTAERFEWRREDGRLRTALHEVSAAEPEALAPVLRACGAELDLESLDDAWQLTIVPVGAARVSSKERREIEAELAPWGAALARYGREAERLARHVEEHPERAKPVFGAVFSELLDADERATLPEPTDDEEQLLEAFEASTGEVVEAGQLDPRRGTTLDERVLAVYSPFCGEIVVALPREPLEAEGFVPLPDGVAIPRVDLFTLLLGGSLSPVSPDPLATQLRETTGDERRPFDLDAWIARPREVREAPSERDLRRLLEQGLSPAERYVVTWSASAAPRRPNG